MDTFDRGLWTGHFYGRRNYQFAGRIDEFRTDRPFIRRMPAEERPGIVSAFPPDRDR